METFEKLYFSKYVVTFNNDNEYIEMGSPEENPDFGGLLIREQFSSRYVELYPSLILFFYEELNKIIKPGREEPPLVKLVHKYGWNNYHSDFAIVVSDYDGCLVRFFIDVSHQFNSVFLATDTKSPEFKLEHIIQILGDALPYIKDKKK